YNGQNQINSHVTPKPTLQRSISSISQTGSERSKGRSLTSSQTQSPVRQHSTATSKSATTPTLKITPVRKPQSNRPLIKNALQICLAGTANEKVKQHVLSDLESSPASHFIILFRGVKNHAFKGLYSYDPSSEQVRKVYTPPTQPEIHPIDGKPITPAKTSSTGPETLDTDDVLEYYKYDSGSRSFKAVPTKSWGKSIHAVAIGRKGIGK
ncbi:hypothetical protein HDU76_008976, partial [Blyttiomyces sp. JEL0837]